MKGERVNKAKFHIGIMTGGRVHSSVQSQDDTSEFQMEMWPMGLLVQGPKFRTVVTYNNIVSFDLDPASPAKEDAPKKK